MRRYIVGTAGHIDHGKTALLRALTGIDADRLPEEKARGITIDLGFAHLEEGDTRIGFVDAPGHERFVRNMLAGAGGLDALLLVIAADEGIKPQTREHFAIARLLGLKSGLVALTKIDRVSEDIAAVVESEIRDFLEGSFLARAPILPVSAKSGQGLSELKAALLTLAGAERLDREARPLRLPVDRAFTVAGFGPVVTGSLISGTVSPEDRIEILPERKTARVRRVEVHGAESSQAIAGERTSVNLSGVSREELHRGQMIASPGILVPSERLLIRVHLLPGSPALKSGDEVVFYHFASETEARVRLFGRDELPPGGVSAALLTLASPVSGVVLDRFILRRPSPPATIGGGEILDCRPPRRLAPEDLSALGSGDRTARLRRRVEREAAGLSCSDLSAAEFLSAEEARAGLAPSIAEGAVIDLGEEGFFLGRERAEELARRARRLVEEDTRRRAGLRGVPRATLLEKVFSRLEPRAAEAFLERLIRRGELEEHGEEIRIPGSSGLPAGEQSLAAEIERRFDARGLDPPAPAAVAAELSAKPKIVEGLVSFLLREKRLLRLPGGMIVSARAVESLIERLRGSGRKNLTVPEFKEMFSLTRRVAIPLLEHLDERRVTRRVGETREVLPAAAPRKSSTGG